ncbi:ras-related protein Rab-13-like isoform X2 [Babylonia areolata]|uniref:ras-related protein Rab-13-like isoform X2 n=1 Tax=Babylonia areolata TaxID=304850 RepID=UPI003FD2E9CC
MGHTSIRSQKNLKVAVIGDKQVGKTSLINRYAHDDFSHNYVHSRLGEDLQKVNVTINDEDVKVTIVDLPGHEYLRTGSLTSCLYRDVDAVMLVFDLTRTKTLDSVPGWLDEIKRVNSKLWETRMIFLVGNKNDLTMHRTVHYDEAKNRSLQYKLEYFETSALSGYNVQETFDCLLRTAWKEVSPTDVPTEKITVSIPYEITPRRNDCCCIT